MNTRLNFFIIFMILLVCLLVLLFSLIIKMKKNDSNINSSVEIVADDKEDIEDILKKYNMDLLEQQENDIYISSEEDLYMLDGTSNRELFESVVNKLIPFFEPNSFCLVNQDKKIKISAQYNYKDKYYNIIYNDMEDFYSNTSGKDYINVEGVKIANTTQIFIKDNYLNLLYLKESDFSTIKKSLGAGNKKDNNYIDYLNDTMSIRVSANNIVKNIIFHKGYEEDYITDNITINSKLSDVYSKYSTPPFGSLDEGFLGYLNNDFYIFYYEDEISVYPYFHKYNKIFEQALDKYLESKDLEEFITTLTNRLKNYDYMEYDKENGNAYLLYADNGIEINIKNNSAKGITLYSNYYYTNTTKKYIKSGMISLNYEEDLVNIIESKRRNNTLELN